jgi:hypothetical protein
MELYNFAFLNADNEVIDISVFDSENPSSKLLDAVKAQFGAVDYKSCTVHGDAYIGGTFLDNRFVVPKPYPSWVLNVETYEWESPVGSPVEPNSVWDEETLSWIPVIQLD